MSGYCAVHDYDADIDDTTVAIAGVIAGDYDVYVGDVVVAPGYGGVDADAGTTVEDDMDITGNVDYGDTVDADGDAVMTADVDEYGNCNGDYCGDGGDGADDDTPE